MLIYLLSWIQNHFSCRELCSCLRMCNITEPWFSFWMDDLHKRIWRGWQLNCTWPGWWTQCQPYPQRCVRSWSESLSRSQDLVSNTKHKWRWQLQLFWWCAFVLSKHSENRHFIIIYVRMAFNLILLEIFKHHAFILTKFLWAKR